MKDLLRISELSREGLVDVLGLAREAKELPHHWRRVLRGETVVLYLAKPSTRTRISFETAVARLGGTPVVVGPDELQLGRGETIEDTARVISGYARALIVRTSSDGDLRRIADAATIPVVNALTDRHHPCQALADLLTLEEHFGHLDGLKLAYVGDGDNVAHSLLEACALAGVDITVATPPGYEPDDLVVRTAERIAERTGALVMTTHDPLVAVSGANAVYTDVWLSMGVPEDQRAVREQAFWSYEVTDAVMAEAADDAVFLHCLPAHRGEEVAASVIDGPRSLVFEQAENRLYTAHAVLLALLAGHLLGADEVPRHRAAVA